jgi:hypothetical protein
MERLIGINISNACHDRLIEEDCLQVPRGLPKRAAKVLRVQPERLWTEFSIHLGRKRNPVCKPLRAAESARIAKAKFRAVVELEAEMKVLRGPLARGRNGKLTCHAQVYAHDRRALEIDEDPFPPAANALNACIAHRGVPRCFPRTAQPQSTSSNRTDRPPHEQRPQVANNSFDFRQFRHRLMSSEW